MAATYKSLYYHKVVLFFVSLLKCVFASGDSFVFKVTLEKISATGCNAA